MEHTTLKSQNLNLKTEIMTLNNMIVKLENNQISIMSGFGNQKKESFLLNTNENTKKEPGFAEENKEWAEQLFSTKVVAIKTANLQVIMLYCIYFDSKIEFI